MNPPDDAARKAIWNRYLGAVADGVEVDVGLFEVLGLEGVELGADAADAICARSGAGAGRMVGVLHLHDVYPHGGDIATLPERLRASP